MTYLDRAIKDGYAIITGPENKQKIIYVTSDNHTENYNDPEEKVRAEFWAELIYEYDYPAHRIKHGYQLLQSCPLHFCTRGEILFAKTVYENLADYK